MSSVDAMGWIIGYIMVFTGLFGLSSVPVKYIRQRFPDHFGEGKFGYSVLVLLAFIACVFLTVPCAKFLVWVKYSIA
ncbi:hypothetical protein H8C17_002581 [Salmonella enterica]|nr:hypothetical protein [Salmonella enterica]